MKFTLSISTFIILLTSCNEEDKLKLVIAKFPDSSVQEVIYYDLPISEDSTGIKEIYFNNGKLQAKGGYKNGDRNGKWVCYRQNGNLEWTSTYLNGQENGITECYMENGSWKKVTLINGCKNGPTIEFNIDSTGFPFYVFGQYKDCKETGLWVWQNKEQKIFIKQFFNNGKPDKMYENYHDNGIVNKRAFLRQGYIDSMMTFDSLGKLINAEQFEETTWGN